WWWWLARPDVAANDVSSGSDAACVGRHRARKIDRCKDLTAQQKSVLVPRGITIEADDIALRVDPKCLSGGRTRKVNRAEYERAIICGGKGSAGKIHRSEGRIDLGGNRQRAHARER